MSKHSMLWTSRDCIVYIDPVLLVVIRASAKDLASAHIWERDTSLSLSLSLDAVSVVTSITSLREQ